MKAFFLRFRGPIVGLMLGIVLGSAGVGAAWAAVQQPHMQAAMSDLQSAQSELKAATTTKGGHRQKALQFVAQAINEVSLGIQYAAQ